MNTDNLQSGMPQEAPLSTPPSVTDNPPAEGNITGDYSAIPQHIKKGWGDHTPHTPQPKPEDEVKPFREVIPTTTTQPTDIPITETTDKQLLTPKQKQALSEELQARKAIALERIAARDNTTPTAPPTPTIPSSDGNPPKIMGPGPTPESQSAWVPANTRPPIDRFKSITDNDTEAKAKPPVQTETPKEIELKAELRAIENRRGKIREELKTLKDENNVTPTPTTPEPQKIVTPTTQPEEKPIPTDTQRLVELNQSIEALEAKTALREYNDERTIPDSEKLHYLNLLLERENLQTTLNQKEQESQQKRTRKEKIIKIVAGVTAGGVAIATPPLSIAAVIGITIGGRFAGKNLKHMEERIRTKTKDINLTDRRNMTTEQLEQLNKQIERRKWWSDRLGETSAVLIGGATGYGIGSAIKNIFNMLETTSNIDPTPPERPNLTPETPLTEVSQPPIIESPTTPTNLFEGQWLKASDYGWEPSSLGWQGKDLAMGNIGGSHGALQKTFVEALQNLGVDQAMLQGQQAGNVFTQNLWNVVSNGVSPEVAARTVFDTLSLN
ncbi:hypothetical protein K8R14_03380 [bacterium]|nr:hypothetical protein [bacterium]